MMGVKGLLVQKFIVVCGPYVTGFPVEVWDWNKKGLVAHFRLDETTYQETQLDWGCVIDIISDKGYFDRFFSELFDDDEGDQLPDEEETEDPFATGELVFDADGRVHFARDLLDR